MSIINLKKVCKIYNEGKNNEVNALKGIDLQINNGETLAIMGVSGSGKTTLLNIIGCLDNMTSGQYLLNDKDITLSNQTQLAQIRNNVFGFVLQSYGLIESDNVYKNVRIPLLFSDKYKTKQIKSRVDEVLCDVNILDLKNKKVKELSGGQKQRVAIARALVNDPDVILADEPTSALDSKTAEEIMQVLQNLNQKGKTIIVVTHDQKVADKMSKVVHIVDGKLVDNI